MLINPKIKSALVSFLLLFGGMALYAQEPPPPWVKFEVVSVRVMSEKESLARLPDFFGPDVAVRLRLSTTTRGIRFLGWVGGVLPRGFKIQHTSSGNFWLYGGGGTEKRSASPGIKTLLGGIPEEWIVLPDHSAVEWEDIDTTKLAGETHAYTIFLKEGDKGKPKEVFSNTFVVPSKPPQTGGHRQ